MEEVPDGYLAFDGKKFKKERYPKLAKIYKSCALPDLRGKFIRGLGGNSGALLEAQGDAIRNITGASQFSTGPGDGFLANYGGVGAIGAYGNLGTGYAIKRDSIEIYRGPIGLNFDASRVVPTADENRPENVAFQYICWSGEYYV